MESGPKNIENVRYDNQRAATIERIRKDNSIILLQIEHDQIVDQLIGMGLAREEVDGTISDSANDWGDNLNVENYKKAKKALTDLKKSKIIDLPAENCPEVTIGSRVTVKFIEENYESTFIITGNTSDDLYGMETIKYDSDLGNLIYRHEVGEMAERVYKYNGETKNEHIEIIDIAQS